MSSDTEQHLQSLREFAAHYHDNIQKGEGMTYVTHAEMAVVLDEVVGLLKSMGVGLRKSALGQKMPERRGWEKH